MLKSKLLVFGAILVVCVGAALASSNAMGADASGDESLILCEEIG